MLALYPQKYSTQEFKHTPRKTVLNKLEAQNFKMPLFQKLPIKKNTQLFLVNGFIPSPGMLVAVTK